MYKISWGNGIAILYAVFVLMIGVMIWHTVSQRVDLVSEDYYEKELDFQHQIDGANHIVALGQKIRCSQKNNQIYFELPSSMINATVKAYLFKPDDARNDKYFNFRLSIGKPYISYLTGFSKGNYLLKLSGKAGVFFITKKSVYMYNSLLYFTTAFTFGLLGSVHCVGMCGPIALTMAARKRKQKTHLFFYALGKTLTYVILGLCCGLLGQFISLLIPCSYISVVSGGLLLIIWLSDRFLNPHVVWNKWSYSWVAGLKNIFSVFLDQQSNFSSFLSGVFNGFLPCGLLSMALAGALGAGGWWQSMFFMFIFGLSTLPLLIGFIFYTQKIAVHIHVKTLIPAMNLLFALLLIMRGLHLGIPYLSPAITHHANARVLIQCHVP